MRETGLPFRQAPQAISALASHALAHGLGPDDLSANLFGQSAARQFGLAIALPDDLLRRALDAGAFVRARMTPGGAAPEATDAVLRAQAERLAQDRRWFENETRRLAAVDSLLMQEMYMIV